MRGVGHYGAGGRRGVYTLGGLLSATLLVLLCSGFSQPELGDRHPGVKASVASGKLSRPQRSLNELEEGRRQRGVLASGKLLFTSVFHHTFLRFVRKQNLHLWPVVSIEFERSPPLRS